MAIDSSDLYRNINLKTRNLKPDIPEGYVANNKLNYLLYKLYKGVKRENVINTNITINTSIKNVNPINLNLSGEKINTLFLCDSIIKEIIIRKTENKDDALYANIIVNSNIITVNDVKANSADNNINSIFSIDCTIKSS